MPDITRLKTFHTVRAEGEQEPTTPCKKQPLTRSSFLSGQPTKRVRTQRLSIATSRLSISTLVVLWLKDGFGRLERRVKDGDRERADELKSPRMTSHKLLTRRLHAEAKRLSRLSLLTSSYVIAQGGRSRCLASNKKAGSSSHLKICLSN